MKFLTNLINAISYLPMVLSIPCRILSLSGGGSHGAFEAGVIRSMVEEQTFQPWDVHLGVSAGGISTLSLTKDDYEANSEIIQQTWSEIKTTDIIQPLGSINSISGNTKIYDLLKSTYMSMKGNPTRGYFGVGVTDLTTGNFIVKDIDTSSINYNDFVASASIPVVFPPVGSYVDGGLQKNEIFLSGLKYCDNKYDSVIMDLVFANYESEEEVSGPWSLWKIIKRSFDLIREDFDNMYFKSVSSCQDMQSTLQLTLNIIMPETPITISALDFDHGEYLWNLGYYNHTVKTVHC